MMFCRWNKKMKQNDFEELCWGKNNVCGMKFSGFLFPTSSVRLALSLVKAQSAPWCVCICMLRLHTRACASGEGMEPVIDRRLAPNPRNSLVISHASQRLAWTVWGNKRNNENTQTPEGRWKIHENMFFFCCHFYFALHVYHCTKYLCQSFFSTIFQARLTSVSKK